MDAELKTVELTATELPLLNSMSGVGVGEMEEVEGVEAVGEVEAVGGVGGVEGVEEVTGGEVGGV
ncbi:MAG: hypothetical protein C4323_24920, partial [Mastigocladus sp. ERB_26_2]